MGAFLKCHLHNALVMCKNGLVTVTKIEAPDFDVFIRRTRYNKFRVVRNIHGKNWQLAENQEHRHEINLISITL